MAKVNHRGYEIDVYEEQSCIYNIGVLLFLVDIATWTRNQIVITVYMRKTKISE